MTSQKHKLVKMLLFNMDLAKTLQLLVEWGMITHLIIPPGAAKVYENIAIKTTKSFMIIGLEEIKNVLTDTSCSAFIFRHFYSIKTKTSYPNNHNDWLFVHVLFVLAK